MFGADTNAAPGPTAGPDPFGSGGAESAGSLGADFASLSFGAPSSSSSSSSGAFDAFSSPPPQQQQRQPYSAFGLAPVDPFGTGAPTATSHPFDDNFATGAPQQQPPAARVDSKLISLDLNEKLGGAGSSVGSPSLGLLLQGTGTNPVPHTGMSAPPRPPMMNTTTTAAAAPSMSAMGAMGGAGGAGFGMPGMAMGAHPPGAFGQAFGMMPPPGPPTGGFGGLGAPRGPSSIPGGPVGPMGGGVGPMGGMGYGMAPRPAAQVFPGQQPMRNAPAPAATGAVGGGGANAYKASAASVMPKSSLDALDVWGK